ncbi:MAG: TIGR01777 family oxidoreductase [Myxococcota bacterium]
MHVLLTGATGTIGRRLTRRLKQDGHLVTAYVRDLDRASALLGPAVALVHHLDDAALAGAVEACDAVINLAGAPVAQRWTPQVRRELYASRVDVTRRIVDAIVSAAAPPSTLLSASGVGWYASHPTRVLDESMPAGEDFLARLSSDWEAEAVRAGREGPTRVATLRIGLVLTPEGGALARMAPLFRWGLGASVGSGRQYVPFIHVDDVLGLLLTALDDPRYEGPFNACAPQPVPQRTFAKALGRALHRPVPWRAPSLALRCMLGRDAMGIVTGSWRAVPTRALRLGYRFTHPDLPDALSDLYAAAASAPLARLDLSS